MCCLSVIIPFLKKRIPLRGSDRGITKAQLRAAVPEHGALFGKSRGEKKNTRGGREKPTAVRVFLLCLQAAARERYGNGKTGKKTGAGVSWVSLCPPLIFPLFYRRKRPAALR